jgi:hypothetical protein
MYLVMLPLHDLNLQWVFETLLGPCFPKKQIPTTVLNYICENCSPIDETLELTLITPGGRYPRGIN